MHTINVGGITNAGGGAGDVAVDPPGPLPPQPVRAVASGRGGSRERPPAEEKRAVRVAARTQRTAASANIEDPLTVGDKVLIALDETALIEVESAVQPADPEHASPHIHSEVAACTATLEYAQHGPSGPIDAHTVNVVS